MNVAARILLTSLLVFFVFFTSISQINPDSLGMDDNPLLNNVEARYFNIQAQQTRGDFNFNEKRVGLFMENNGKRMFNKQEYFDNWAREHFMNKDFGKNQLFILSPEEKERSKGFDAIVVSWSEKRISEGRRAQLVSKLRKFKRITEAQKSIFE